MSRAIADYIKRQEEFRKRSEKAQKIAEIIKRNIYETNKPNDALLRINCMQSYHANEGKYKRGYFGAKTEDSKIYKKIREVDHFHCEIHSRLFSDEAFKVYEAINGNDGLIARLRSRRMTRDEYHHIRRSSPEQLIDEWKTDETREILLAL